MFKEQRAIHLFSVARQLIGSFTNNQLLVMSLCWYITRGDTRETMWRSAVKVAGQAFSNVILFKHSDLVVVKLYEVMVLLAPPINFTSWHLCSEIESDVQLY